MFGKKKVGGPRIPTITGAQKGGAWALAAGEGVQGSNLCF